MSLKRPCKISSDCFCYVCGYYINLRQMKHKIIPETKFFEAYEAYFGMKMGDQDKSWAPHFCCGSCRSTLEGWMRGSRKCMPFAIPRIWREPTNHHDDCYFCMVDISKYKKTKDRKKIVYPSIPSSIAPANHCAELPIPQPPTTHAISSTSSEDLQVCKFLYNVLGFGSSSNLLLYRHTGLISGDWNRILTFGLALIH